MSDIAVSSSNRLSACHHASTMLNQVHTMLQRLSYVSCRFLQCCFTVMYMHACRYGCMWQCCPDLAATPSTVVHTVYRSADFVAPGMMFQSRNGSARSCMYITDIMLTTQKYSFKHFVPPRHSMVFNYKKR